MICADCSLSHEVLTALKLTTVRRTGLHFAVSPGRFVQPRSLPKLYHIGASVGLGTSAGASNPASMEPSVGPAIHQRFS